MKQWSVRTSFHVSPFYDEKSFVYNRESFEENLRYSPFFYDMFANERLLPWEEWERRLPAMFLLWKRTNVELATLYEARNKKAAREPMIAMIALLFDVIFWLNEKRIDSLIHWETEFETLVHVPVNGRERLKFLLDAPDHYHSYQQVKAMFSEVEKIYFRKVMINKRKV